MTACTPEAATCRLGVTRAEQHTALGWRIIGFDLWMEGQTMTLCDIHGPVVFQSDLDRYLRGGRAIR